MSYICNGYSIVLLWFHKITNSYVRGIHTRDSQLAKLQKMCHTRKIIITNHSQWSQSQDGEYNAHIIYWTVFPLSANCANSLTCVCVWDECTLYDQECQIGWPLAHSAPLDEWNYKKCLSYTFLSNEVREGGGILIMKVAYNSLGISVGSHLKLPD